MKNSKYKVVVTLSPSRWELGATFKMKDDFDIDLFYFHFWKGYLWLVLTKREDMSLNPHENCLYTSHYQGIVGLFLIRIRLYLKGFIEWVYILFIYMYIIHIFLAFSLCLCTAGFKWLSNSLMAHLRKEHTQLLFSNTKAVTGVGHVFCPKSQESIREK